MLETYSEYFKVMRVCTFLWLLFIPIANSSEQFQGVDHLISPPNQYRNALGDPGALYWQQRVDHDIVAEFDVASRSVTARSLVTYHNNSGVEMNFLWFHLDQNRFKKNSPSLMSINIRGEGVSTDDLVYGKESQGATGGFDLHSVKDADGRDMHYRLDGTLLYIELAAGLPSGNDVILQFHWTLNLIEQKKFNAHMARTGYEYFPQHDQYIYLLSQWFPRPVVFSDYQGWHLKQYLGQGEFGLEFGDYSVKISVPESMVVAATGTLDNPADTLTKAQYERFLKVKETGESLYVITPEDSKKRRKSRSEKYIQWQFTAENVRDFSLAVSPLYSWKATSVESETSAGRIMLNAYFPNDVASLWDRYALPAMVHSISTFESFTFAYPYPNVSVAFGPVLGIEGAMLSFVGIRPESDGTYSKGDRNALVGFIAHEVGHNWFPMIVNSDERRWSWLDEGITSFLECQTHKLWQKNALHSACEPYMVASYMAKTDSVPVMSDADTLIHNYENAYSKVSSGLAILRETVMGREQFSRALKDYAESWMYKRPTPADFFRTFQKYSSEDLGWFWKGWFYSTDNLDYEVAAINRIHVHNYSEEADRKFLKGGQRAIQTLTELRDAQTPTYMDRHPHLADIYDELDPFYISKRRRKELAVHRASLDETLKRTLDSKAFIYEVFLKNHGDLAMPVKLRLSYTDGTYEDIAYPASIWRRSATGIKKLLWLDKELTAVLSDPVWELPDIDRTNNRYPRAIQERYVHPTPSHGRFNLKTENLMREFP